MHLPEEATTDFRTKKAPTRLNAFGRLEHPGRQPQQQLRSPILPSRNCIEAKILTWT